MIPVSCKHTTDILKSPAGDNVSDLPICRTYDSEGKPVVISVWELSDGEIEVLIKRRRLYFMSWGHTHPPISMTTQSIFQDGE